MTQLRRTAAVFTCYVALLLAPVQAFGDGGVTSASVPRDLGIQRLSRRGLQGVRVIRRSGAKRQTLKIVQSARDAQLLEAEKRRLGARLVGGFELELAKRIREPRPERLEDGRRAGKLTGSPSRSEFRFENIRAMCASEQLVDMRKLPLSLSVNRDPQHMFVTKATAQAHFENDRRWGPFMAGIEQWLPARTRDIFENQRQFETCAIVGNHGNLRKAEWGKHIDQHQAIFRFNRGPTEGYEAWVGSRTTYRITNNAESRVYAHAGWRGKHREVLELEANTTMVLSRVPPDVVGSYMKGIHMVAESQFGLRGVNGVRTTMLDKRFLLYAADVIDVFRKCMALRKGAKGEGYNVFMSPSTGVMMVMGAIHLCKHVTVYGIGESQLRDAPYQYFKNFGESDWGSANTDVHNFRLEAKFIKYLALSGIIRKCEYGQCIGKDAPSAILSA